MRTVFRSIGITFLLTISMVVAVHSAPTRTISYQGYLKDGAGKPVNGSASLSLSLYDTAVGGTPLWTEKQDVAVINGVYRINLGEVAPFNLPFDQQYWLGIIINGDPEMQPRQQLQYSPFAFRSTIADTIPDKTVTAAKIGQVCADGEVLRYDSQTTSWRCNPIAGGFPSSLPMVGALAVSGLTPGVVSPSGPDPNVNIILYGFDFQLSVPSGGKLTGGPLKIVCNPGKFAPAMTQSSATGKHWPAATLWLKGADGLYAKYIELTDVVIDSMKPIPPTRPGEPTLVEYTLEYASLLFRSLITINQKATVDFMKGGVVGCAHPDPNFSVAHGLQVDLGTLFGAVYPISSYSSTVVSGALRASFSAVTVSGPLGNDGPCFMTDLNGRHYQGITIYTAAPQSTAASILLESRVMLIDVSMNSYRLYTTPSGVIQQEMSFVPAQIYWGYYPINPATGANDPIVESGWDIVNNSKL
jgi:hypothetical protein